MDSQVTVVDAEGHEGRRLFKRRSDAIIHGSRYQKAAGLVDYAQEGDSLPEEISELPSIERPLQLYFRFTRFETIWTLNYFALIILNFFEKPLWCSTVSGITCNNRVHYFLGKIPYLTNAGSLAYEGVTDLILVVHILFPMLYTGSYLYWKSPANKLKVIMLLILAADLVVYILYLSPVAYHTLPFRIAPYLRVVFFMFYIRKLRDSLVVLVGMIGTYLNVLVLCLLFLLFSSWLAYVIFEDTQQGTVIFVSYPATLYQMFVLFTTSNNPDVWIPAYESSRWSFLFFALFVLVGVYFLTNLILAVEYESFKGELAKQVDAKDEMRIRILRKAFYFIDENGVGHLDKEQCITLFKELNNYRTIPKLREEEFELTFNALDNDGDFKINAEEFNEFLKAIGVKFEKAYTEPWLKKFSFYNSPLSEKLISFVNSRQFGSVFVFVLLLNLGAVIAETKLDIQNKSAQNLWQKVEFVFGWIYVFEVALKVYACGFENLWNDKNNRVNFIVTLVIVIGETATLLSPKEGTFLSNKGWIRYLLVARILRLIRLLMHVQRYQAFVDTFLEVIQSLLPYLGIVFCAMCIYCTLGIQVFGGLVNAGNSDLPSTDLSGNNYLLFNFNDFPNGMVTLFNLLVMGNWQVWMKDYATLTGTTWTYVYFVSFYLITVVLLLNLIVAFVLEAFFAVIDLGSAEEDREGTERKGRRRVGQTVDRLLHHMLKGSLHHVPPAST